MVEQENNDISDTKQLRRFCAICDHRDIWKRDVEKRCRIYFPPFIRLFLQPALAEIDKLARRGFGNGFFPGQ